MGNTMNFNKEGNNFIFELCNTSSMALEHIDVIAPYVD
jgi:hypothetical protein